jgi:hypothetical protein
MDGSRHLEGIANILDAGAWRQRQVATASLPIAGFCEKPQELPVWELLWCGSLSALATTIARWTCPKLISSPMRPKNKNGPGILVLLILQCLPG